MSRTLPNLPILMLSVHQDEQTITRVFVAGADDYISKPVVGPELIARITNRLQRRYKQAPLLPMKTAYHSLYQ